MNRSTNGFAGLHRARNARLAPHLPALSLSLRILLGVLVSTATIASSYPAAAQQDIPDEGVQPLRTVRPFTPSQSKPVNQLSTDVVPPGQPLVPQTTQPSTPIGGGGEDPRLMAAAPAVLVQTEPSCLNPRPLIFEDVWLERFGQQASPAVQPVISAGKFFGAFPLVVPRSPQARAAIMSAPYPGAVSYQYPRHPGTVFRGSVPEVEWPTTSNSNPTAPVNTSSGKAPVATKPALSAKPISRSSVSSSWASRFKPKPSDAPLFDAPASLGPTATNTQASTGDAGRPSQNILVAGVSSYPSTDATVASEFVAEPPAIQTSATQPNQLSDTNSAPLSNFQNNLPKLPPGYVYFMVKPKDGGDGNARNDPAPQPIAPEPEQSLLAQVMPLAPPASPTVAPAPSPPAESVPAASADGWNERGFTPACPPGGWCGAVRGCAPYIGAEATFLAPIFSNHALVATTTELGGTTVTQQGDTQGASYLGFAPRLWAGIACPDGCGIRVQYWGLTTAGFQTDPLNLASTTDFTGFTATNIFKATTFDLEGTREFCWKERRILGSFGVRYAGLSQNETLFAQVVNPNTNDVLTGYAVSSRWFHGTGLTFGLQCFEPIYHCCCGDFNLFLGARGSAVFGIDQSQASTSAQAGGLGNYAISNNAAFVSEHNTLMMAELRPGIQWNKCLNCGYIDRCFARLAFEYQYWGLTNGLTTTANSFAGHGPFDMMSIRR